MNRLLGGADVEQRQLRGTKYQEIEDYGVIGDLHSAALVGMNGSIDFMCFPRFDSPSIFAALLDSEKGGRFELAPTDNNAKLKQLYLTDSCILLSRFLFADGVAEVSDYMPIGGGRHAHDLVRVAKSIRGTITFRMRCQPKFNYGRTGHRVEQQENVVLFIPLESDLSALRLRSSRPVRVDDGAATAEFILASGESAEFVLEEAEQGQGSPSDSPDYVSRTLRDTLAYWRTWVGRSRYQGRWREIVNRSAQTLKLLTYKPTGAIVASPTFGLPEEIGGVRNWDYRYTWIRDSSFTIYALMRLGYTSEAADFMKWVEERCYELSDGGSLQLMYGIDGNHSLTEETLGHFEGYKGSSPVRIGNAAYRQLQLDIYGELLDSVYLYDKYGEPISHDLWMNLQRLVNWVKENWRQEDEGIWEVRGGRRHFLLSRVMCWTALDRAVRLAVRRSLPAPLGEWIPARDAIYQEVYEGFWNPEREAFMQSRGTDSLDASALLLPLVKFVSPLDPRWLSTLRAVEENLVYDSLVYRYRIGKEAVDGLSGKEGTFNMCSFWYVECLSRSGDIEKARFYFEKMLGYANHVGLYSEELGPRAEFLGNFPQAFTHLGLISAAFDLNRRLSAEGYPQ